MFDTPVPTGAIYGKCATAGVLTVVEAWDGLPRPRSSLPLPRRSWRLDLYARDGGGWALVKAGADPLDRPAGFPEGSNREKRGSPRPVLKELASRSRRSAAAPHGLSARSMQPSGPPPPSRCRREPAPQPAPPPALRPPAPQRDQMRDKLGYYAHAEAVHPAACLVPGLVLVKAHVGSREVSQRRGPSGRRGGDRRAGRCRRSGRPRARWVDVRSLSVARCAVAIHAGSGQAMPRV